MVMKLGSNGGLAPALQVKEVSAMLNGDKVRRLVNTALELSREEMVTLLPFDNTELRSSHVTSMFSTLTSLSVAVLREMVQVRVMEIDPAYSGPDGTVMLTSGVETGK